MKISKVSILIKMNVSQPKDRDSIWWDALGMFLLSNHYIG